MLTGCGYVHDDWAGTTPKARLIGAGRSRQRRNVALEAFLPKPRNQNPTNACVRFALACHQWTQANKLHAEQGLPPPEYPSERWGYWLSLAAERRAAGLPPDAPLHDAGTTPGTMLAALTDNGDIPESLLPWDAARVLEEPTVAEAVAALSYRGISYEMLGFGNELAEALLDAVDEGTGACLAFRVGHATMADAGDDVLFPLAPGEAIGAHMLFVCGYRFDLGRRQYRVQNSWGASWRDGGRAWLDESLVISPQCFGACRVEVTI